jgi:hypothetical protein
MEIGGRPRESPALEPDGRRVARDRLRASEAVPSTAAAGALSPRDRSGKALAVKRN